VKGVGDSCVWARARTAIVALCATCLVATASPASAHTERWGITHTMDNAFGFYGTIEHRSDTGPKACLAPRAIALYRATPEGDPAVAHTTSFIDGERGSWEIDILFGPGTYYAVAKREVLQRSDRHRHICRPRRSNAVIVS
jgi:hypothetical protein